MSSIQIPLANVVKTTNICYDDATIQLKVICKTNEIFVGSGIYSINNGCIILSQEEEHVYYQKYEREKQLKLN